MIIGLSGKKQVGKDTVAKIIQNILGEQWENKKFASGVKKIVCILLGCTMVDLEDDKFKNSPLGEEWWKFDETVIKNWLLKSYSRDDIDNNPNIFLDNYKYSPVGIVKMTPRLLLQYVGTECGREIIHPNIWVNMLMKEYTPIDRRTMQDPDDSNITMPDWVISDIRFPNEIKAVEDRNGLLIRILRDTEYNDNHKSEIALDNYPNWDYTINNNGSIQELEIEVLRILKQESLI